ncbi:MAG: ROK family protein [Ekhidna sp.]|nr:ROK family protein [Ekhidna sp.]
MSQKCVCSIDIGGSHISSGLFANGKLLAGSKQDLKLDSNGSAKEIYSVWSDAINQSINSDHAVAVKGLGIAMPDPFDYKAGVALFTGDNSKYKNLHDHKIEVHLAPLLGENNNLEFRFINDATAFALGEDYLGAGKDYNKGLYLTLGTGFGSSFINNGLPITTGNTVPKNGMLWHHPYNGKITEDFVSTRWFVQRFKELYGLETPGVKEIVDQIKLNKIDNTIFKEFGQNLGSILSQWIKDFDADAVIIGGNIMKAFSYFEEPLINSLKNQGIDVPVKVSKLGEDAPLVGSSLLFKPELWDKLQATL